MENLPLSGSLSLTPIAHPPQIHHAGDEPYYRSITGNAETLVVHLHTWAGTMDQFVSVPQLHSIPNAICIAPNFGGLNNHPEGAGHPAQLERIKRVIDKTKAEYAPLIKRTLLVGASGGAYVGLMVIGTYPGLIDGASLWVGIHDLAAWWAENPNQRPSIEACLGGPPSGREAAYLSRSPKGVLPNARDIEVYLNAGTQDVECLPHHMIDAHNQITGRPGVTSHLTQFNGGHVIYWDQAVSQLGAVIARLS